MRDAALAERPRFPRKIDALSENFSYVKIFFQGMKIFFQGMTKNFQGMEKFFQGMEKFFQSMEIILKIVPCVQCPFEF